MPRKAMSDDTAISVSSSAVSSWPSAAVSCPASAPAGAWAPASADAGSACSAAVAAVDAIAGTASPGAHSARVMPAGAPGSTTGTLHSASAFEVAVNDGCSHSPSELCPPSACGMPT